MNNKRETDWWLRWVWRQELRPGGRCPCRRWEASRAAFSAANSPRPCTPVKKKKTKMTRPIRKHQRRRRFHPHSLTDSTRWWIRRKRCSSNMWKLMTFSCPLRAHYPTIMGRSHNRIIALLCSKNPPWIKNKRLTFFMRSIVCWAERIFVFQVKNLHQKNSPFILFALCIVDDGKALLRALCIHEGLTIQKLIKNYSRQGGLFFSFFFSMNL